MRAEAKLLVVGIDGLRWDRVPDAGASRLIALRDRGVFAPSLIPLEYGVVTVSGPGWSTKGSVDMAGHGWGATSVEYAEMVRAADICLGELLDAIEHRSSRASEHWLIMVTTDRGHLDPGGHGDFSVEERATFLLYSGDGIAVGVREDARMVDVAPTALAHFGLDTPGELDGRPLIVAAPTAVA